MSPHSKNDGPKGRATAARWVAPVIVTGIVIALTVSFTGSWSRQAQGQTGPEPSPSATATSTATATPPPTPTLPPGAVFETGSPTPTPTPRPLPPGPPRHVRLTPGNQSITVEWDHPDIPGRSPVTGYRLLNVTTGTARELSAGVTSWTETGLTNGVLYQFQLAARSAAGAGESVITNAIAPIGIPSAPRNVLWSLPGGDGAVLLSWEAPHDSGASPVLRYEVSVRRWDNGQQLSDDEAGPSARSLLLTGLPQDVEMFFLVRAVNATGPGPYADTEMSLLLPSPGSLLKHVSGSLRFGSISVLATPEQDEAFAEAVSAALGVPVSGLGRLQSFDTVPGRVSLFLPFTGSMQVTMAGQLEFEVGQLAVRTEDGTGAAVLTLSDSARLEADVRLYPSSVGLEIDIGNIRLVVEPVPGAAEASAAASRGLGKAGASLSAAVTDVTALSTPAVRYSMASRGIFIDGTGAVPLPDGADAAFTVAVTGWSGSRSDTLVEMTLSAAWLDSFPAGTRTLAIIKTEEGGRQFVEDAECEETAAALVCTATFAGEAGGFSAFTLAALVVPGAAVTPTAAPTALPQPTPSVQQDVTPTAPPSGLSLPTPPAGGKGEEGGGISAWVLLAVLSSIGLMAAAGVMAIMWTRRPAGPAPAGDSEAGSG